MEIIIRDRLKVSGTVRLGAYELSGPLIHPVFPDWFTSGVVRAASNLEATCMMQRLLERTGRVRKVDEHSDHNLVTDVGLDNLVTLMLGSGFEAMAIALGTGNSTPDESDTALDSEQFRKHVTARVSSSKQSTWHMFVDDDEGNGFTYQEAGLTNNTIPNAASLLARGIVPTTLKESGVLLTLTWDWNYA